MTKAPAASDATRLAVGLAIADDLLREGLSLLVADVAPLRVTAAVRALDTLAEPPDVIVIDIRTDAASQLAELGRLRDRASPRVVALHDGLPAAEFTSALEAGVSVLVDLRASSDSIISAIVGTSERSLRRWVRPRLGAVPLSRREHDVLELIALGRTSADIAHALGISIGTVEHHKRRVFRKLSATNQAEAVAIALRAGLIGGTGSTSADDVDPDPELALTAVNAAVVGAQTLLCRSVERVLADGGIPIVPLERASAHSVALLVEPTTADWSQLAGTTVPVVVLRSAEPDGDTLLDLVTKGTHAVLPVSCNPTDLVDVTRRVGGGDTGLTRAQTRRLADSLRGRAAAPGPEAMAVTRRELDILRMLDRGLSVKQAAQELGISPRTVENTRRVLYRKLAVRNRAEAIATAYATGVLGGDRAT